MGEGIESEPTANLEAITTLTDNFLDSKLGKITDVLGGVVEGAAFYTGLYVVGIKIVSKLTGVEIDPAQVENILATAPAALLSMGFGARHLRPIEAVNDALKSINILKK